MWERDAFIQPSSSVQKLAPDFTSNHAVSSQRTISSSIWCWRKNSFLQQSFAAKGTIPQPHALPLGGHICDAFLQKVFLFAHPNGSWSYDPVPSPRSSKMTARVRFHQVETWKSDFFTNKNVTQYTVLKGKAIRLPSIISSVSMLIFRGVNMLFSSLWYVCYMKHLGIFKLSHLWELKISLMGLNGLTIIYHIVSRLRIKRIQIH